MAQKISFNFTLRLPAKALAQAGYVLALIALLLGSVRAWIEIKI